MPRKLYWLKEGCLFVQLDDDGNNFLSVVVDTNNRLHYTPTNDTAAYLLQLLVNSQGIHEDDLKTNVLAQYNLTDAQADANVSAFLQDLDVKNLLSSKPSQARSPGVKEAARWTAKKNWPDAARERTEVVAGGTLISLGRVPIVKNVYKG